jgi:ubiquinone/menaquinone biosynthesis C-methylase UbiE
MNFKFLFPSFRNRYLFVRKQLQTLSKNQAFECGLNLGTGEGDYDRMFAGYVQDLIACDVNEEDINHARELNKEVENIHYEVNDALNMTYANQSFDLVLSSEVIEHVGKPEEMIKEIYRVLTPGGYAILTFPSREFPFTYDPINRVHQWFRKFTKHENLISQGAYAFGHDYLIDSKEFKKWAQDAGFEIVKFRNLSGYIVGLLEMYWTGLAQSYFKKNSKNITSDKEGGITIRPNTTEEPKLVVITDALLWVDDWLFHYADRSLGKGVVLRKTVKNVV